MLYGVGFTVFFENAFKTMEDATRFTKNHRFSRIRRWMKLVTNGVNKSVFEEDLDGLTIPQKELDQIVGPKTWHGAQL